MRCIYVYCPSKALKAMFARDLEAQGFTFGDGVQVSKRAHDFGDIMAIHRDFTVCFCGYACHVQFGPIGKNLVQVEFLDVICHAGDVNAFLVQHGCTLKVIVDQINSITDFYLGDSILLIGKDGPEVRSQYYGGIKYLLENS